MEQKIITNPERTLFYCWAWDKWISLQKLGRKCFGSGCRRMYEPVLPHFRKAPVMPAGRAA